MFLGERLHKFNASAQYAAPLMADFGAEIHDKTSIRYIDTGTQAWRAQPRNKVVLKHELLAISLSRPCMYILLHAR